MSSKSLDNPIVPTQFFVIEKSSGGEGSRGGRVVGHTISGKPIYSQGHRHISMLREKRDSGELSREELQILNAHEKIEGRGESKKDPDPKPSSEQRSLERDRIKNPKRYQRRLEIAAEIERDREIESKKPSEVGYEKLDGDCPRGRRGINKGADGHVATIAVMSGTKILMGKRNDNGKWTNPGGHMEDGEDAAEGAKRELKEEAGLDAGKVTALGQKRVKTFTGKDLTIHAFTIEHDGKQKPTAKNDPDKEVKKWEWIETKDGLPAEVKDNLHSPKNVVLQKLNLLKSEQLYIPATTPGRGVMSAPQFFIEDPIIKGLKGQTVAGHKYLRKYQRGGQWIYVYHEGTEHGRAIPEELVNKIKKMAEEGHEGAKDLHGSLQAHDENHLKMLRQMADEGHQGAHEHLKKLGIDRDQEKLEEDLIPKHVANKDDADKELTPEKRSSAIAAVKKEIDDAKRHLEGHRDTPIAQKILGELSSGRLHEMVSGAKTPRQILDATAKIAAKLEELQGTTSASRPGDHKTYGNHIYNNVLGHMKTQGVVSQEYAEHHKRTANQAETKHIDFKHVAAAAEERRERERVRQERERAEREEQDRRDLAEVHGSMAHHMSSLMATPARPEDVKRLHKALKNIFGKDLRKEDWLYDFSEKGLDVKISDFSAGTDHVNINFIVKDAAGNLVSSDWRRRFDKEGGKPHIYNSRMFSARGADNRGDPGARLGVLVNQSQQKFLKAHTTNGFVSGSWVDVGCYNWANQGFSFKHSEDLDRFRASFKEYLARKHNVHFSDEDMKQFTEPCHFAGFHIGEYTEETGDEGNYTNLTEKQRATNSIDGEGKIPLKPEELSSGRTRRIAMHVGKKFMLGRTWAGKWSVDNANPATNPAQKWVDNYSQMKTETWKLMDEKYVSLVERARAPGTRTPGSVTATPSSSRGPPPSASYTVPASAPAVRRVRTPPGFVTRQGREMHRWMTDNARHMSSAQKRTMRGTLIREASRLSDTIRDIIPGVRSMSHEEMRAWIDANHSIHGNWSQEKKIEVERLYYIKKIQGERLI